jgi:hypothetical protein
MSVIATIRTIKGKLHRLTRSNGWCEDGKSLRPLDVNVNISSTHLRTISKRLLRASPVPSNISRRPSRLRFAIYPSFYLRYYSSISTALDQHLFFIFGRLFQQKDRVERNEGAGTCRARFLIFILQYHQSILHYPNQRKYHACVISIPPCTSTLTPHHHHSTPESYPSETPLQPDSAHPQPPSP